MCFTDITFTIFWILLITDSLLFSNLRHLSFTSFVYFKKNLLHGKGSLIIYLCLVTKTYKSIIIGRTKLYSTVPNTDTNIRFTSNKISKTKIINLMFIKTAVYEWKTDHMVRKCVEKFGAYNKPTRLWAARRLRCVRCIEVKQKQTALKHRQHSTHINSVRFIIIKIKKTLFWLRNY